jgi:hypothetical protein
MTGNLGQVRAAMTSTLEERQDRADAQTRALAQRWKTRRGLSVSWKSITAIEGSDDLT